MKISMINYSLYKTTPLNFKARHTQNIQDFDNPLGALCHTSVFFRYPDTDVKTAEILKETFPNKKLKVVSQGCSEGEEVYTFAMICENKGIDADITGVDIDQNTVNKAQKGAYELDLEEYYYFISEKGKENLNSIKKHFSEIKNNDLYSYSTGMFFQKNEDAFKNCSFQQGDVLKSDKQFEKGSVNAIFCRNILYHLFYPNNKYHNQKVCNEAVSKLKDNLCDNGLIMFAPYETSGYDDVIYKALVKNGFKCLEEKYETIWQKSK